MRSIAERRGLLEEVQPPKLPRKFLPAEKSNPRAAFKPAPRMDTPEKLQAELLRQRRRYAPFLKDLAPKLERMRIAQRLEDFQWRLETDADRADFRHLLDGAGEWTAIKVPHFGGPIGRAVAYYRTTFNVTREMLDKGRAIRPVRRGGLQGARIRQRPLRRLARRVLCALRVRVRRLRARRRERLAREG